MIHLNSIPDWRMKKMEIDITKLIEVTQELVHNGMMSMAAKGTMPVQDLEDENGNKFKLSVTMERI